MQGAFKTDTRQELRKIQKIGVWGLLHQRLARVWRVGIDELPRRMPLPEKRRHQHQNARRPPRKPPREQRTRHHQQRTNEHRHAHQQKQQGVMHAPMPIRQQQEPEKGSQDKDAARQRRHLLAGVEGHHRIQQARHSNTAQQRQRKRRQRQTARPAAVEQRRQHQRRPAPCQQKRRQAWALRVQQRAAQQSPQHQRPLIQHERHHVRHNQPDTIQTKPQAHKTRQLRQQHPHAIRVCEESGREQERRPQRDPTRSHPVRRQHVAHGLRHLRAYPCPPEQARHRHNPHPRACRQRHANGERRMVEGTARRVAPEPPERQHHPERDGVREDGVIRLACKEDQRRRRHHQQRRPKRRRTPQHGPHVPEQQKQRHARKGGDTAHGGFPRAKEPHARANQVEQQG